MRMFSQPLRDLVFSMDLVQEAKQKKKSSILVRHFLSVLMFVPIFSVIRAYKVIGISVRHFKYHGRGLAIFLVKNLAVTIGFLFCS